MKRNPFLLTMLLIASVLSVRAQTAQDADTLLWNGKRYAVAVDRCAPSVVMSYFQRTMSETPFESWSLNNNRGHIAKMELIDEKIKLLSVKAMRFRTRTGNLWTETGIDTVVTPDYFLIAPLHSEQPLGETAVEADWYSGILELRLLPKDKKEQKSDEAQGTRYLNVVNGQVVDNVFISDKIMAEYQSGRAKLGHDQAKIHYMNERFKEFYLHCAADREEVTYNGHNGLFQQRANGLTLVMEFFGNDPLQCGSSWIGVPSVNGAPFGTWLLHDDSLFVSEIKTHNSSGQHRQQMFDYLADSVVGGMTFCHRRFVHDSCYFADWITGEYVIHYGSWQTNSFGVSDYVVSKTQEIRVKEGVVVSSKFSPRSFEEDEAEMAATSFVLCNEASVRSVEDKQLAEAVGNFKAPKKSPEYEGGKTALRNWFLNRPLTDERAKDRLFRVRIGFMVNCNGEAGRWQVISKGKGELFEFANMVLDIVKTMPQKWSPAEDKKGNKMDCWQVLEFTLSNGDLTNANYK